MQQSDELEALLRGLPPDLAQRVRALDGLEALGADAFLGRLGGTIHRVRRRVARSAQLLVRGQVHPRQRARAHALGPVRDEGEAARLPVDLEEAAGLTSDDPELDGLLEDDGPTHDRQAKEDEEDELCDKPGVDNQLAETAEVPDVQNAGQLLTRSAEVRATGLLSCF